MESSNTTESPLMEITDAADPAATDAFALLANETRLAILLALWDASEPFEGGNPLSFSELRDRVGIRDSGQFNYHLGKLEGQFIESTDEGYTLRPEGNKITRAIIAGVGLNTPTLEHTDIGLACPRCDGVTKITYRNGWLFQLCTECSGHFGTSDELPDGTLFTWRLDAAGLANRSPEEMYAAASNGMLHRTLAMLNGVCPECSGAVESRLETCTDHDLGADGRCSHCGRREDILAFYQCTVCKFSTGGPPSGLISQHPAVVAFYYDHGINLQYNLDFRGVKEVLELGEAHEQTLASTDPPRVRVTIRYEGDELKLLLDEEMNVVETMD